MKLEIGKVYQSRFGNYLRLDSIGDLLYFFTLVTKDNIVIEERRNKFGHVVVRNKVSYTPEVVGSFKKVNI